MSMRINSSVPSFYDAGRVSDPNRNLRVNPVEKVNPVEEAKGISSLTRQHEIEELQKENRGVVQTRVSPENSFQKAMVTDNSFAFERMAGKLLDKLPTILRDMQNLPAEGAFEEQLAEKSAAPAKVVITEDGRVRGQRAEAPEQEDIKL
ncbi:MAG: hypothetical protein IJU87_03780 [Lachnospiraceae bacterium]|nr:hypothetical protein [Lachnospiraceae bacterium]